MTAPGTACLIALGSNLGDRLQTLRTAVEEIDGLDGVVLTAISSLYETAPVGGPDGQEAFYNAAIEVISELPAHQLLTALHRIEAAQHRERAVHWGPRTLDLDLLTFGDELSDGPDVLLPHPRMHLRRFVLVPVCDIAAEQTHPRLDRTMSRLLAALPAEAGDLTMVHSDWRAAAPQLTSQAPRDTEAGDTERAQ